MPLTAEASLFGAGADAVAVGAGGVVGSADALWGAEVTLADAGCEAGIGTAAGAATVATGIRVPSAVGDFLILRAVRESGGAAIAVEEKDILQAVEDAARDDGFLLCPEGGAVLAGWRSALERGLVTRDETALLFNCANGNKYPLADASRRLKLAEARAEML